MSVLSASEQEHSGKVRKPRSKKKTKEYWGTTAESLIQRFGRIRNEKWLMRKWREKLYDNKEIRREATRLASECEFSGPVFLTALAVVKLDGQRIDEVAEYLEQLTSHRPGWKEVEIDYIKIRLQKLLDMPFKT